MALKARLNAEEYGEIDEVLQAEYTEADGTFTLDVESVGSFGLEDVGGLKSAYSKQMEVNKTQAKQLKTFDGIEDPAAAIAAIGKVQEMSGWTPEQKVQEKLDSVTTQLLAKHRKEVEALTDKIRAHSKVIRKEKVTNAAAAAISELGGDIDLLMPHVDKYCDCHEDGGDWIVTVRDDEGNPQISSKSGSTAPMTIKEKVSELKATDKYSRLFASKGSKGTQTSSSSSSNSNSNSSVAGVKYIRPDQIGDSPSKEIIEGLASGNIQVRVEED